MRRVLVQLAWAWNRYQPESALTQWFHRRFRGPVPASCLGHALLAQGKVLAGLAAASVEGRAALGSGGPTR